MRVILVPVADRPESTRALNTAFDLGKRLGASVYGCHIRPHADSGTSISVARVAIDGDDAAWESVSKLRSWKNSHIDANALFVATAAEHEYPMIRKPGTRPGAVWVEKVGSPQKVLSSMGPVSDLIVVSRPRKRSSNIASMFIQAALFNTMRPVLVLPQTGKQQLARRISIAWNQSAEASLAVSSAIALLRTADEVNIITCGPENGVGPKSVQLATYLRFWGIESSCVKARGSDPAKALLEVHQETRSDLMIMGAYSRHRLREQVFGGVTEHMLKRASIPVLMLHT